MPLPQRDGYRRAHRQVGIDERGGALGGTDGGRLAESGRKPMPRVNTERACTGLRYWKFGCVSLGGGGGVPYRSPPSSAQRHSDIRPSTPRSPPRSKAAVGPSAESEQVGRLLGGSRVASSPVATSTWRRHQVPAFSVDERPYRLRYPYQPRARERRSCPSSTNLSRGRQGISPAAGDSSCPPASITAGITGA
jgi:hypothetical protein